MSMDIAIFKNEEFGQVRSVMIGDEPWFVGKDVAEALGYSNASKAVSVHVSEEDRILKTLEADSQNGNVVKTQTALLNEMEQHIGPSFKKLKSHIYHKDKNGF